MPGFGSGAGQSWNFQGRGMYVPPISNPRGALGIQGYRGTDMGAMGGTGPLRFGGSIGGSPQAGFLPFAQQAQAQQQAAAAAEAERQRQANAAAEAQRRQQAAAEAAEAERIRMEQLQRAGAFSRPVYRYAGQAAQASAAPAAADAGTGAGAAQLSTPTGISYRQPSPVATNIPGQTAASLLAIRRAGMGSRRQMLGGGLAIPAT